MKSSIVDPRQCQEMPMLYIILIQTNLLSWLKRESWGWMTVRDPKTLNCSGARTVPVSGPSSPPIPWLATGKPSTPTYLVFSVESMVAARKCLLPLRPTRLGKVWLTTGSENMDLTHLTDSNSTPACNATNYLGRPAEERCTNIWTIVTKPVKTGVDPTSVTYAGKGSSISITLTNTLKGCMNRPRTSSAQSVPSPASIKHLWNSTWIVNTLKCQLKREGITIAKNVGKAFSPPPIWRPTPVLSTWGL